MPGRGQKQFAFLAQEHADIATPHHGDAQELCLLVHSGLKTNLKQPPEAGDAGWQPAHGHTRQWLASDHLRQVQGEPTDTAVFKIEQRGIGQAIRFPGAEHGICDVPGRPASSESHHERLRVAAPPWELR